MKEARTLFPAIAAVFVACGAATAAENAPLPTFEETCFQSRPTGSQVSKADAEHILEAVGPQSRLGLADKDGVKLKGLFRIRDPRPSAMVPAWATPETVVRWPWASIPTTRCGSTCGATGRAFPFSYRTPGPRIASSRTRASAR